MSGDKKTHKITDEQFLETLKENDGSCTDTANAIQKKYGISYTRQSAHERAKKFPEVERQKIDLREEQNDQALLDYANDENVDIRLRIQIRQGAANRLCKYRLLSMKLDAAKPKPSSEPEGYFEIDGKEINF